MLTLFRRCPAHRRKLQIRNYYADFKATPSKGDKVVVAMSGGVDSSVTAKILVEQGYDLSAVFMRNWDARDESGSDQGCEWKKDWRDVQKVCRMLSIPVKMIDLSREYWLRVFEPSINFWTTGLTPNPDVWCNKEVKFGALMDSLTKSLGFSEAPWFATGHYAHKDWVVDNPLKPRPRLLKAVDNTKDQTYYLSSISEGSLSRALFPLSGLKKTEVRELAAKWGLPTAAREESMGICFVGERKKFSEFLSQYVEPRPGPIVDLNTGIRLGVHQGLWSFTIGQKAKIGGVRHKLFVAKKNVESNTIFVVPGADHPALYVRSLRVPKLNWIWADSPPEGLSSPPGLRASVKYRHRMSDLPCTVYQDTQGLQVTFDEPQKGVSPGQFATFYLGDWCLGSGVLENSEGWT